MKRIIIAAILASTPATAQIYNRDSYGVGLPSGGSIGSYRNDKGDSVGYTDVQGPSGNHYYIDGSGKSCTSVPTASGGSFTSCN